MPLYTVEAYMVEADKSQQFFPELAVFYRFFSCIAPMILFPGLVPFFAKAVGHIGTVRKNLYGSA